VARAEDGGVGCGVAEAKAETGQQVGLRLSRRPDGRRCSPAPVGVVREASSADCVFSAQLLSSQRLFQVRSGVWV